MTGRINSSKFALGLISVGAIVFGWSSLASANGNENTDVVAPYAYLPGVAIPPATGPYTTHYHISSNTGLNTTVNVKCYNSTFNRVGPAGGTAVDLTGGPAPGHDIDVWNPVSLGLTTDPDFDGFGWCYFAGTSGDDFAVTFLAGSSVSNTLINTNNSRVMAIGTAQGSVTDDDANIPYWTREGGWDTYVLLLNPTAASAGVSVDIYDSTATLQDTYSTTLSARDLDFFNMKARTMSANWGNADINRTSGTGEYVSWVSGLNPTSGQAFLYDTPLDKDDIRALVPGDRP